MLTGTVITVAQQLAGVPVLHATTVVVDGRAVMLVGRSGAGKSTLAATLVQLGAQLLTEDASALTLPDLLVQPGPTRLRLEPEVHSELGDLRGRPRVLPHYPLDDKRWVDASELPGGVCREPRPIGALYVLASRTPGLTSMRISSLSPARAVAILGSHWWGQSRLGVASRRVAALSMAIASRVPVNVVEAPAGREHLRRTACALLKDTPNVPVNRFR